MVLDPLTIGALVTLVGAVGAATIGIINALKGVNQKLDDAAVRREEVAVGVPPEASAVPAATEADKKANT